MTTLWRVFHIHKEIVQGVDAGGITRILSAVLMAATLVECFWFLEGISVLEYGNCWIVALRACMTHTFCRLRTCSFASPLRCCLW